MSDKNLEDMTFNELIQFGILLELDAIVQGRMLKQRVMTVMDAAARWQAAQTEKAIKAKKG